MPEIIGYDKHDEEHVVFTSSDENEVSRVYDQYSEIFEDEPDPSQFTDYTGYQKAVVIWRSKLPRELRGILTLEVRDD